MIFAAFLSFTLLVFGIYIPRWNDWLILCDFHGIGKTCNIIDQGWFAIFICVVIQVSCSEAFKAYLRADLKKSNEYQNDEKCMA